MAANNWLSTIIKDIKELSSLMAGMVVTGRYFAKKQVTVHYPREQVDNLSSFRGPLMLLPRPENPEKPRCIACMMCVSVCPSGCIKVVKKKAPKPTEEELAALPEGEAPKKKPAPKEPAKFIYDYSLCSLCGLCAENCPVKALSYSNDAYMVGTSRDDFKLDLLARMRSQNPVRPETESNKA